MKHTFSRQVKEAISLSREVALQLGNTVIEPGHLALGLLREGNQPALAVLRDSGLSPEQLAKRLEEQLRTVKGPLNQASMPLADETAIVIREACNVATVNGSKLVEVSHVMTALLPYVKEA